MSYFTHDELKCPCCGECLLMEGFLDRLNDLREAFGKPMNVNSGCRCLKHNAEVGGKGKSFHLINAKHLTGLTGACAVDISIYLWPANRVDRLLALARADRWSVGIANTFIHLDNRTDYPEAGWPKRAEWRY